jgi:hypothetical protein
MMAQLLCCLGSFENWQLLFYEIGETRCFGSNADWSTSGGSPFDNVTIQGGLVFRGQLFGGEFDTP